ncbi:MAG: hypothetical protein ACWGHO_03490 [Candidatus Moraniibacteriota bacterium]
MEDSMLALLGKSRMFSVFVHGFFAEAKAIPPDGFAFWLPSCFREYKRDEEGGPLKRFRHELKSFFRLYLENWLSENKQSKAADAAIKNLFSVSNFFEGLALEKDFLELKSGKGPVKIHEPISNAEFHFKRMGDLLAFNIYRLRDSAEEHISGRATVLALCRRKDPSNNQGVYELVQRVEITLGLPEVYSSFRNGKAYSLTGFGKEISQALHRISINFSPEQLIEKYQKLEGDSAIGQWRGLQIAARLIHPEATNKKDHIASDEFNFRDRAMSWRRGNLVRSTDSRKADFALMENFPIALMISVSGSLPQREIFANDCSRKYLDEQFLIANVGSMVAMSLGTMMLDKHDEKFYEMNPVKR